METESNKTSFPIIGIGASAGGLEAFEQFFTNIPLDSDHSDIGMAFVIVQHLDPNHKSILVELIRRYTKMNVLAVEDGMVIEPNSAYIIPPNWDMAIMNGQLHLIEPLESRGLRLPIDFFFRSLAQDQGEQAICIILSGTGTDGTLGLRSIKGQGGTAIVQEPESAKYDGMPRSAIATGLVDFVLPPSKMPEQLIKYVQHPLNRVSEENAKFGPSSNDWLQKVFVILRDQTGHDFSYYKEGNILRRIEKRMMVNQIANVPDYLRYLQKNAVEVETLIQELLIGVTSFFRDPEAFAALEEEASLKLFHKQSAHEQLRVWVPACSTGEEAYSIAMLIQEYMNKTGQELNVKIFATDISTSAIEIARMGTFPDGIAIDVSLERLQAFFTKVDNTYLIKKNIREMIIFAVQDITKDPPFSNLNLVSCRNLLIYMKPELQKKVLSLFQYALCPDGYLFLGTAENIGELADYFACINRKWRLFQRKEDSHFQSPRVNFSKPVYDAERGEIIKDQRIEKDRKLSLRELTERTLLAVYSPPCVIINEEYKVLYFHGRTGKYLEPASGEASFNVIAMAREGIKPALANAIRKAMTEKTDISYEGLRVKTNGDTQVINLSVKHFSVPALRGLMMIVFEDVIIKEGKEGETANEFLAEDKGRIAELEQELRTTREYLQSTNEELETSNEELKSINEELQSSNEELQSANEELETSREELQSVNEELMTVNAELESKLDDLSKLGNDVINLMANIDIGIIFLDEKLHIQRFTPEATKFINLIQSDLGRSFNHVVSNLAYDHLIRDVREVLDTTNTREIETQTKDGVWCVIRIMPYRTTENVISGVVLTFRNITEQKLARDAIQEAREYAEGIVDTVREPILVLDADLKVTSANKPFYKAFKVTKEKTIGKFIYDLGDGQWNIPKLRELLNKILPEESVLSDFVVEHEFQTIGKRKICLNARQITGDKQFIFLALEDVTKQKKGFDSP